MKPTTGHVHLTPTSANARSYDRARSYAGAPQKEYRATFLTPGLVKAADGSDTNWLIPANVAERDAPLFDGVACYLDHPELFGFGWRGEPQVKNLIGVTFDAGWDPAAGAITGSIRLYADNPHSPGAFVAALLDAILADQAAGRPIPDVGLSAVFYHDAEQDETTELQVTTRFKKVESVDLVYSPGAGGYVKAALALCRTQQPAACSPTERTAPMTEQSPSYAPTYVGANAQPAPEQGPSLTDALFSIADRLDRLQQSIDYLSADLGAEEPASVGAGVTPALPPAPNPPAADPEGAIAGLRAQVDHLTQLVAGREEARTVQGMGRPRAQVLDPLPEFQSAWDWVFGVHGAPLPRPELRRTDSLYRYLSGDLNWTGVFNAREALTAATTTTLADMAVNAMNKVIIPLWNRLDLYRWYELITSVQPTDGSLHDMAWIQFGGIGDLPVVAEGAAYTELTVSDTKETASFYKYGGYVGITDKVLRNSDIAQIQAIPRALAIAAVQTRSAKIAAIFTTASGTGPTLAQDSTVLFHTDHSNLATTALSYSAWTAARLECMKHAELGSSKRTGIMPKFCLVPADLYDTALEIFGYGAGPGGEPGTANNDVNLYALSRPGDPRPVPVMVPDWTDTNNWAYLADPELNPVIQMAYADNPGGRGHPAPQLYTVTSPLAGLMFTNDVLPIKIRDYWAYGVAGYRGIGKRNVS